MPLIGYCDEDEMLHLSLRILLYFLIGFSLSQQAVLCSSERDLNVISTYNMTSLVFILTCNTTPR